MSMKVNLSLLKEAREEKKISMQEMAEFLGFKNASTYLKYENGEYSFKLEMLPKLSKKLGIPYKNFFVNDIAKIEIENNKEAV